MLRKILGFIRKLLNAANEEGWVDDKANQPVVDDKVDNPKDLT